jgi:hypothetical protein
MSIKHPGYLKFKEDLQKDCKKHGIKLKLIKKPTVPYSNNKKIQISGYFDSYNMELVVATGKEMIEWIEILIHESCHLDQFVEDSKVWNSNDYDGTDGSALIDLWLNRTIELKPYKLNKMINDIIYLERDCDLRAIEKIKKYGLEDVIDLERYCQKSNAYHLSYIAVKRLRKWNKRLKAAYQVEEVLHSFPKHISDKFTLSKYQYNLLKKYCY